VLIPYKFDSSDVRVTSRDVESYSATAISQRAPGEVQDLYPRGLPV
jgi:hypothetical protein